MLELKKAELTPELARFCVETGIVHSAGSEFYAATCGTLTGCCAFTVAGERLIIEGAYATAEFGAALCDGLVRATYQYALGRGAKTADFGPEFSNTVWNWLAAFGHAYKTDNDIDNFLTNCKKCAR